jgi:hypothetical protein
MIDERQLDDLIRVGEAAVERGSWDALGRVAARLATMVRPRLALIAGELCALIEEEEHQLAMGLWLHLRDALRSPPALHA